MSIIDRALGTKRETIFITADQSITVLATTSGFGMDATVLYNDQEVAYYTGSRSRQTAISYAHNLAAQHQLPVHWSQQH